MSEVEDGRGGDDGLQFDRADYGGGAGGGVICAFCRTPITFAYYDINGASACDSCEPEIREVLTGSQGAARRVVLAFIVGLLAASLGAALYGGIIAAFGFEVGIVSLVVGWLVGKGVNRGSQRRGGLGYQIWAVLLTYVAVTCADVPAQYELNEQLMDAVWFEIRRPFLGEWSGRQLISLLIIGFGVYEAWVLNRSTPVRISGPLQVGSR